jgi:hypothetical protein
MNESEAAFAATALKVLDDYMLAFNASDTDAVRADDSPIGSYRSIYVVVNLSGRSSFAA